MVRCGIPRRWRRQGLHLAFELFHEVVQLPLQFGPASIRDSGRRGRRWPCASGCGGGRSHGGRDKWGGCRIHLLWPQPPPRLLCCPLSRLLCGKERPMPRCALQLARRARRLRLQRGARWERIGLTWRCSWCCNWCLSWRCRRLPRRRRGSWKRLRLSGRIHRWSWCRNYHLGHLRVWRGSCYCN